MDPLTVPAMTGVAIAWAHLNAQGGADNTRSRSAAALMVAGYGIVFRPALQSNHTRGRAIDMTITQHVGRTVVDGRGQRVTLRTEQDLHNLGASYGVHKLVSDPPHWSDDGH
jgi:D-alanyl-D-alanine dipeptidase